MHSSESLGAQGQRPSPLPRCEVTVPTEALAGVRSSGIRGQDRPCPGDPLWMASSRRTCEG